VHTRSIPLAASVDLEALAATTPGMVGADLANLANEAALLAARRNHHTVQISDFNDSLEKILLGAPRRIVLSAADRERTAYHEAGHALIAMITPGADPVRKVSIIPRGAALGVTLSTPDDDQVSYTREDLVGKVKVALGGRVAEETVLGSISTGAESDIDQVTAIARQMVGRWGMSEAIGFVRVLPADGRGSLLGSSGETSEATQRVLDEEVRRLIDTAHLDVTAALTEHRDRLETLAQALLKSETLDELDAYAAAQMPPRTPGAAASAVVGHTPLQPRLEPSSDTAPRDAT
jgi:cell division protease FtsH